MKTGVLRCPERRRQLGQLIRRIQEVYIMNKDVFEGKWKQMRGQAKVWWGKLTDDDLEKVGGKFDNLLGVLQEKYGYTRQQAEGEYKNRTRRK